MPNCDAHPLYHRPSPSSCTIDKYSQCTSGTQCRLEPASSFSRPGINDEHAQVYYLIPLTSDSPLPNEEGHCLAHSMPKHHHVAPLEGVSFRTSTIFQKCGALEFHNCHFTNTGGDFTHSGMHRIYCLFLLLDAILDVHHIHSESSQSLPLPISTPTLPSAPTLSIGLASSRTATGVTLCLCLLVAAYFLS